MHKDKRVTFEEQTEKRRIVMVRAGGTARVEGWITCRLRDKARAATKGCHDPELTDDTHKSRCVDKFFLSV